MQGLISNPSFSRNRAARLGTLTANILDNDPSSLLPFRTVTLNGDYQAAGVGLRGQTSGTINLAGIPAGSTVTQAYLYWDMLNDAQTAALGSLTLAGSPVTGTLIGTAPVSVRNSYVYRADVTSLVTGNGAYLVAGVASGGMIFAEGASLVVVYSNASLPTRTVVLIDGNDLAYLGMPTATNVITGFTAPARVNAKTTFIVGDGNTGVNDSGSITGSLGTLNLTNTFDSSDGGIWDTDTYNVSSLIAPGDTSLSTSVNFINPELLIWVAQVFSIGLPGIIVTPSGGSTDISEAGVSDTYAVVLANQPAGNVLVQLTPDAQVAVNATTLTFTPANWSTAQTVTVTAVDDGAIEGVHAGLVTQTVSSADAGYVGLPLAPLTANITDNDALVGVTITQSGGATSVAEGGATDTYTVVLLSSPAANVVITLGAATTLTATPSPLTFTAANWNIAQTVTVAAVDDVIVQGPHSGIVTHSATSADPLYNAIAIASITASIADNDAVPGVLVNGVVDLVEGGTGSYTIVLQSLPAANVVINLVPDPQLTLAAASLTFTPANWNTPQTVAMSCGDDTIPEPDQTLVISHTITTTDPGYSGVSIVNVAAHVVDNDGTLVLGTVENDNILVNFVSGKVQAIVNGASSYLKGPITRIVVLAQEGNDFVQITAPTVPVVVVGGDGVDAVWTVGKAGLNTFVLNGTAVTVNGQTVSVGEAESMVLGGRTGNDTFRVLNLPTIPTEFKGDRGNDFLFGPGTVNTWNITESSGGSLNDSLTINGIENWTGGSDADTFRFADRKTVAGKIDGGAGTNDLDYSAYTAPISVNLQTNVATGAKVFSNVQSFRGGQAVDRFIGRNQLNTWTLAGNNAGNVNGVLFASFEKLSGGTLADTFALADGVGVSGTIDGAAGKDILDYSSYLASVAVDMQGKKATNTGGILNLEQFRGGTGLGDTLIGSNKVNRWILSGAGAGTLNTEPFANFENLTGGTLADTFSLAAAGDWLGLLSGGGGQDGLVASTARSNLWTNGLPGAGTLNGRAFASIEVRR